MIKTAESTRKLKFKTLAQSTTGCTVESAFIKFTVKPQPCPTRTNIPLLEYHSN